MLALVALSAVALTTCDYELISGTCDHYYLNLPWGEKDTGIYDLLDQPQGGWAGGTWNSGYWDDISQHCHVQAFRFFHSENDSKGNKWVHELGHGIFDLRIRGKNGLVVSGTGIGTCKITNIDGDTLYNGSPAALNEFQIPAGIWDFHLDPSQQGGCETTGDEWYWVETCYYSGECTITVSPPSLTGDINDDGLVDVTDLLAVIAAWGECKGCQEDIDGDGDVDVSDVLAVIANWGGCP